MRHGLLLLTITLLLGCSGSLGLPPSPAPAAIPASTATPTQTATPSATPDAVATQVAATLEAVNVAAAVEATIAALRPTETPAPTPVPIPTPSPEPPTATAVAPSPTHVPEPTARPTPEPTATTLPTPSPTATPRPTPTVTFTPRPSPTNTPETLADTIARVSPGVVRIVTDQASGSGVIFELDPIDGTALVATNEHVIEGASSIQAVSYLGETYGATLVGIDGIRDIAVLRICCSDSFLALDFADETTLRNGESVIVLGYPLGLPDLRVTQGIISALTYDNGIDRFEIQSDAAINPGNSGGPLMTTRGEVMGLTTFVVRATASGVSVEGFGFSISIRTLLPTLDKLKQGQFVALPTPTPHPSILNGVFSHPDLGYVINVPSGWVVEPRDSDGILIFDGNSLGWISVVVSNVDPSIYPTIAEYRRDWIPGPASTWTDFVIESEIVIFRGAVGTDTDVEGRDFQVRFVEDGNTFEATIQWFIVEGKRYAVAVSQTDFGGSDFGTQLQFAFISFRPFATRRVPTPTPSSFSGQSGGYSG